MPINPNIALQVRGIELQNPIAQYGQIAQLQNAQNQNALAQYQLGAAQRSEETQNKLANFYSQSVNPETGKIDYNKLTGLLATSGAGSQIPAIEKTRREIEAAELTAKNTQSQIDERNFGLQDKKLKFAWNAVGSASTPQAAIAELTKGVKDGVFDMNSATGEIQQLQSMTPEQYQQYRVQKIMGILEAKDKLGFMLPKVARQDIGGQIQTIQDNPALPGYGQPIAGAGIAKTETFADITARKNLGVAQGQLNLARKKFDFEQANPGFELKEGEDGTFYGVNKRTLQAVPVNVGAPAADGAAPVSATPLKGKGTALTESQGNATAFGMRMMESNKILTDLEKAGKKDTGVIKGAVGSTVGLIPFIGDKLEDVSGSIFNALPRVLGGLSPEQQQVAQARINFITALLRKESGAAIGPSEFATAEKNYFPKPGDDDATIAQKQQARQTAIKAMQIQAGPGAKQMGGGGGVPGASANNPLGLPGL